MEPQRVIICLALAFALWLARLWWLVKFEGPIAWSFRVMFSIWFGVAYIITPLSYLLLQETFGVAAVHVWFLPWVTNGQWPMYLLVTLLAYLAYEMGFGMIRTRRPVALKACIENEPSARKSGALLVLMGVIGYLGFMSIYGFDVAISTNIRYESSGVEGNWLGSLFLYTRVWIFIGFLILFICHLNRKNKSGGFWRGMALMLLFALVLYTSIQGASRGYFIYLIVLPGLCYLVSGRRLPIGWIAAFGLGFPILIAFGRTVLAYQLLSDPTETFSSLGDTLEDVDLSIIAREMVASFSHPFASVMVVIDQVKVENFRYFLDVPMAFLFYLKSGGLDFGYSVTYIHTHVLSGEYNSNIPPGLVASGFYQMGMLGVFVFIFLFGLVCRFLQNALVSRVKTNPAYLAIFVFLGFVLGNFVMNGDPRVYFIRVSLIAIAAVVISLVRNNADRRVDFFPRQNCAMSSGSA